MILGAAMLTAGFVYPGAQAGVATTLIVVGAGQVAVGFLLPGLSELEIGPGGLRTRIITADVVPKVALAIDSDRLTRFAYLMCGNAAEAREFVEEALASTRRLRRRVDADEREPFVVRSLIDLLDTAEERRWLRGVTGGRPRNAIGAEEPAGDIVNALSEVQFHARAAFLMRVDWSLSIEDIAALLARPAESVREDVASARQQLRPYIERGEKP